MTTVQHTPGPWFTEHNGVQKIYASGAGDIAHVFSNCLKGSYKANARLIAAAPEMLYELKQSNAGMERAIETLKVIAPESVVITMLQLQIDFNRKLISEATGN